MIYFSFVLTFIAGCCNGLKDRSSENNLTRWSPWWSKPGGWRNKWEIASNGFSLIPESKKKWYYLWIFTPDFVERFPFSSSLFVFITDGWHLLQMLQFLFIFTAFGIAYDCGLSYPTFLDEKHFFLIGLFFHAIFLAGFHLTYTIFKKFRLY